MFKNRIKRLSSIGVGLMNCFRMSLCGPMSSPKKLGKYQNFSSMFEIINNSL